MLSKNEFFAGVNPDTKSEGVALLELEGTINGHGVFFKSGFSYTPEIAPPEVTEIPIQSCLCSEPTQIVPRRLPNRRGGFNQKLVIEGMKLYLRTGEFVDGTLGEIFIDTQKEGTFARSMLNCFAVAISTGLQHGVPLQVFVDQFKNVMFEPKGSVNGSDSVEEATSIIDAIFKELEVAYPSGKAETPASPRSVVAQG